jgi:hypothetical protein
MSWQLGAFGILALGLLGGFAWYERTRPDARIVALVGTLAAFGALGRIAFARTMSTCGSLMDSWRHPIRSRYAARAYFRARSAG